MAKRVLNIASHVVHGHVGNCATTFPMQLHGFCVDVINSVHFSNHTGYPTVKGQKMSGDDLREIIDGMEANQLLKGLNYMLTGYIGNATFLKEVGSTLERIKQ